jgi:seryl-tRNA synthetase
MMNFDVLYGIIGPLITIAVSIFAYFSARTIRKHERELAQHGTSEKFKDRVKKLSAELARSSAEVDKTLQEMETVSRMREEALKSLESKMAELSEREKEAQRRVDDLKNVPLPAVNHFLEMTEQSEKKSAKRDRNLFVAGVVVSTGIAIILKLVFGI